MKNYTNYTISRIIPFDADPKVSTLTAMLDEAMRKNKNFKNENAKWIISKDMFIKIINSMLLNNPSNDFRTSYPDGRNELFGIEVMFDNFKTSFQAGKPIRLTYRDSYICVDELKWPASEFEIRTVPTIPKVKKVIFNNPTTIVYWEDGTKTLVNRQKGERFDTEKAIMAAFFKKCHGNNGKYNDMIRKYIAEASFQNKSKRK